LKAEAPFQQGRTAQRKKGIGQKSLPENLKDFRGQSEYKGWKRKARTAIDVGERGPRGAKGGVEDYKGQGATD